MATLIAGGAVRCPASCCGVNFTRDVATASGVREIAGCSYCDGEWWADELRDGCLPEHNTDAPAIAVDF